MDKDERAGLEAAWEMYAAERGRLVLWLMSPEGNSRLASGILKEEFDANAERMDALARERSAADEGKPPLWWEDEEEG